jgi:hypothetical protein
MSALLMRIVIAPPFKDYQWLTSPIGTFRTSWRYSSMSVVSGRADIEPMAGHFRV